VGLASKQGLSSVSNVREKLCKIIISTDPGVPCKLDSKTNSFFFDVKLNNGRKGLSSLASAGVAASKKDTVRNKNAHLVARLPANPVW
jgi:hypothetical protein